jgi:hypothetical protein
MKRRIKLRPKRKYDFAGLCNRLQSTTTHVRAAALEELQARFRASDELSLACAIMRRTACEIKTHQINTDRDEGVYLINMSFEDRAAKPVYGHLYERKYVIKSWNTMTLGVIISYILLSKQFGRFI